MARRGFAIIFTFLGVALFLSIVGFLAALSGRRPRAGGAVERTLVLRVGGDLTELAPDDVVGYLRGVEGADGARRSSTTCARPRSTRGSRAVLLKPTGFDRRTGPRCRSCATRCSTSGSRASRSTRISNTAAIASTTWRRAADKVFLMPSSPLDLTGVATYQLFLRGTLDKIGAYPDLHHIGDYKTAVNTFTEKGFTPRAQGDGRVAQSRPVRPARARHRRGPQEERRPTSAR